MSKSRIILLLLTGSFGIFLIRCNSTTYPKGKVLYEANCANCHQSDGSGLQKLYPPLAKSDYLKKHRAEIPCLIRYGMKGKLKVNGVVFNQLMQPHPALEDGDITNIINYIYNSWGNPGGFMSPPQVKQALKGCKSRTNYLNSYVR